MRKNHMFIMTLCHTVFPAVVYCFLPQMLGSCSMYEYLSDMEHEKLEIIMPDWPQSLPELDSWYVKIVPADSSGEFEYTFPADQKTFVQKVKKNQPLSICAYPLTKKIQNHGTGIFYFKCAGMIYPCECTEIKPGFVQTTLTWSGGYASWIMDTLITGAKNTGYSKDSIKEYVLQYNWNRLLKSLQQKEEEAIEEQQTFYNPWLLDSQQVLEGISYQNFTATKLNSSGVFSVNLDFPVFSPYVPENQNKNGTACVSIRKNIVNLFVLADEKERNYGILISGVSEKNISLDFVSMPINIEGI